MAESTGAPVASAAASNSSTKATARGSAGRCCCEPGQPTHQQPGHDADDRCDRQRRPADQGEQQHAGERPSGQRQRSPASAAAVGPVLGCPMSGRPGSGREQREAGRQQRPAGRRHDRSRVSSSVHTRPSRSSSTPDRQRSGTGRGPEQYPGRVSAQRGTHQQSEYRQAGQQQRRGSRTGHRGADRGPGVPVGDQIGPHAGQQHRHRGAGPGRQCAGDRERSQQRLPAQDGLRFRAEVGQHRRLDQHRAEPAGRRRRRPEGRAEAGARRTFVSQRCDRRADRSPVGVRRPSGGNQVPAPAQHPASQGGRYGQHRVSQAADQHANRRGQRQQAGRHRPRQTGEGGQHPSRRGRTGRPSRRPLYRPAWNCRPTNAAGLPPDRRPAPAAAPDPSASKPITPDPAGLGRPPPPRPAARGAPARPGPARRFWSTPARLAGGSSRRGHSASCSTRRTPCRSRRMCTSTSSALAAWAARVAGDIPPSAASATSLAGTSDTDWHAPSRHRRHDRC